MSRKESVSLSCPKCGNEQQIIVWTSLNVTLDPEARDDLFQGKINQFECQKCDTKASIDANLLYHDMERDFVVWYFSPQQIEDEEFLGNFTLEGIFTVPGLSGTQLSKALQNPHIVF